MGISKGHHPGHFDQELPKKRNLAQIVIDLWLVVVAPVVAATLLLLLLTMLLKIRVARLALENCLPL